MKLLCKALGDSSLHYSRGKGQTSDSQVIFLLPRCLFLMAFWSFLYHFRGYMVEQRAVALQTTVQTRLPCGYGQGLIYCRTTSTCWIGWASLGSLIQKSRAAVLWFSTASRLIEWINRGSVTNALSQIIPVSESHVNIFLFISTAAIDQSAWK